MVTEHTDRTVVRRVYNEQAQREFERLERSVLHEAEFLLTRELLDQYVPEHGRVLDVGSGPGRYAEYLITSKGAHVGLVDLSAESLRLFQERVGTPGQGEVLFCRDGDATSLEWVDPESFDAVLLMGPLYHLVRADERRAALVGCFRALRPGGVLVAAFISLYRSILQTVGGTTDLRVDIGHAGSPGETARRLLADGQTTFEGMQQWRCWPSQARAEIEAAGFEVLRVRNLEGIGMFLVDPVDRLPTSTKEKEELFDVLRITCEVPDLLGATWHFVCVAKRRVAG